MCISKVVDLIVLVCCCAIPCVTKMRRKDQIARIQFEYFGYIKVKNGVCFT